jgi:hypothetical protein
VNRRSRAAGLAALGLSTLLWVAPAAIFVFTTYPWNLQLYYAHFSLFGLALLVAAATNPLATAFKTPWWRVPLAGLTTGALSYWLWFAGATISTGIAQHESPALREATIARAAYDQLQAIIASNHYREVVFLDPTRGMWASTGYGTMISVLFPQAGVQDISRCDEATNDLRTSPTTLVVRQVAAKSLTVVR